MSRRLRTRRASIVACVLALALPGLARAAPEPLLPPAETGLVTVLGGVRFVPQAPLESSAAKQGWAVVGRAPVTPAVLVPLSYRVDREWSALIELGWANDGYRLRPAEGTATSELAVQTVGLLAGGQRAFDLGWRRVEPYLGFGVGYYLSTVRLTGSLGELPKHVEAHAAGGFLSAGLRIGLGGGWSAVVEERYAFAVTGLGDFGALTVGGNTVALGLSRVWR